MRKNLYKEAGLTERTRDVLSWVVQDFIEGESTKSERYFYTDDVEGMPEGKAVKVTFEYVEAGALCDGGEHE